MDKAFIRPAFQRMQMPVKPESAAPAGLFALLILRRRAVLHILSGRGILLILRAVLLVLTIARHDIHLPFLKGYGVSMSAAAALIPKILKKLHPDRMQLFAFS